LSLHCFAIATEAHHNSNTICCRSFTLIITCIDNQAVVAFPSACRAVHTWAVAVEESLYNLAAYTGAEVAVAAHTSVAAVFAVAVADRSQSAEAVVALVAAESSVDATILTVSVALVA
jgi:hypothetical protein